tara:strand:- start:383 stop:598 length:216 start_codon:yes stop_codon:yes gene_type:complete
MSEEQIKLTRGDGEDIYYAALKLANGEYWLQKWSKTRAANTIIQKWLFNDRESLQAWMDDKNLNCYINEAK